MEIFVQASQLLTHYMGQKDRRGSTEAGVTSRISPITGLPAFVCFFFFPELTLHPGVPLRTKEAKRKTKLNTFKCA